MNHLNITYSQEADMSYVKIGVGGPVGSGKTALIERLTRKMSDDYSICVITNDIYTKEDVYLLQVECNDLNLLVCINSKDLLGEPAVGRRFKGQIWMQGSLNFQEIPRVGKAG